MDQLPKCTEPATYRIQIAGRVNDGWSDFMSNLEHSFDKENGMTITTITGIVADQAALHGLLEHIRDLNLTLISVTCDGPCPQDSFRKNKEKNMKTLIAGSNGMVGSAVTRHLIESGHDVVRLVRHTPGPGEVWWNPTPVKLTPPVWTASTPLSIWPACPGRCAGRPKPNKSCALIAWGPTVCWLSRWPDVQTSPGCSFAPQAWDITPPQVTRS